MKLAYVQFLLIFTVWLIWFLVNDNSQIVYLVTTHLPIMLTMLFGSFVAGSTSLGGGAVAFPVFTKVLSIPSETALVFSLAIQSVGMTAAMLVIFINRIPVSLKVLLTSLLPGAIGVYIGIFELNTFFAGGQAKYFFSLFSLFVAFVLIFDRFINQRKFRSVSEYENDQNIGFIAIICGSFVGGIVNGLIGTGIDFVLFALMIIFSRVGLKKAVATSVCVMASNAIIGFTLILLFSERFTGVVVEYWLAAVPIVVVGAPLGALACRYFHRDVIFYFLMILIILDVVSTALILGKQIQFISIITIVSIAFIVWFRRKQKVPN